MPEFLARHKRLLLPLLIAALAVLAWVNRFTQDDAFISLRYSYNLVHGHGLVWNIGERVEGYTNFLWTLLMAVPFLVGVEPVLFSYLLSLAIFVVCLAFFYRLADLVFESPALNLLALLLLGTNYTFSAYATGGLETQLQTCLFVVASYLLLRAIKTGRWAIGPLMALSLTLTAAVMTRMDSFLLVAIAMPLALANIGGAEWGGGPQDRRGPHPARSGSTDPVTGRILRSRNARPRSPAPPPSARPRIARVLALMLPFALLVGGWLLWKLIYYGDILPNTFYVKVPSGLFKRGLLYVYVFHYSYLLVLFPPLLLIALPRLLRSAQATLLLPLVTLVALWTAYVALVGGDFMEFRFMVPALPPLMILIVWLACCHIRKPVFRLALVALVPLGSLHHVGTFDRVLDPPLVREIDSVTQLRAFLESPKHNWVVVGQTLGQLFGHDGRVTISVTAAGAIPFYSRLPSVDMHGLNDRWIAHHGERADSHPGHQILAPLDYLLARGVNLVIGHPILRPREELTEPSSLLHHVGIKPFKVPVQDISEFPAGAKVVAIPIDAQYSLIVLYLVPNDLVDRKIEERGWLTCPL